MISQRVRPLISALALAAAVWVLFRTGYAGMAAQWLYSGINPANVDLVVLGGFWLCVAWLCCMLIDLLVWQGLVERRTGQPAPRLLVTLVRVLVFVLFIGLVTVYVFEKRITALVVSSGAIGIVAGLALQRTINDFFSGVALNMEGPFKVGHWLEINGVTGRVVERTWRAVHLVTLDSVSVIVPNSALAEGQFLNYNAPTEPFRVNLPIALEYAVPVPDAKRTLLAATRAAGGVLTTPSPDVLVTAFGNDGVEYEVRFYVRDYANMRQIRDAVASSISQHIWQAGMSVPYPKRDVYFAQMPARHLDRRTDREALLARIDLFASLEAAEVQAIGAALREHGVEGGVDVVRQDDEGTSLFLVVDGLFEVRRASDGHARPVARLGPGQCFGEMSLLSGEPRSATVTAVADGTLYELDREGLSPILRQRPELAEMLGRILVERQVRNEAATPAKVSAAEVAAPTRTAELVRRIRLFFSL